MSSCVQPADDTHTRDGIFRLLSVGANACQRLLTAAVGLREPPQGVSQTSTTPQFPVATSDQLAGPDALTTLGQAAGYFPGGSAGLPGSKQVPAIGCPQALPCAPQAGADVMWQAQADNDGSVGGSLAMSSLVSSLDMLALEQQSEGFNASGMVWGGAAGDMVPPAVAAAYFDTTATHVSLVSSRDGPAAAMGLIAEGPGAGSSSSNSGSSNITSHRMSSDSTARLQHYASPKGRLGHATGSGHMVGTLQQQQQPQQPQLLGLCGSQQAPLLVQAQQPPNMAMASPQLLPWRPGAATDGVRQPAVSLQQHLQQQQQQQQQHNMLGHPAMRGHQLLHHQQPQLRAQQGLSSSVGAGINAVGMPCDGMGAWHLAGMATLPAPAHLAGQQQPAPCYTYIPATQPAQPCMDAPLLVAPGGRPGGYALHRPVLLGSRANSEAAAAGLPPGAGPAGGTRLFVGNLGTAVDELRLVQLFAPFGDVVDVQVMWNTKLLARGRRVNREFAFISFSNPAAAARALAALHGSRAPGLENDSRGITVEYESGSMLAQLRSHQ